MFSFRRLSLFIITSLALTAPLLPTSAQTTYRREEKSLLELRPVSGDWVERNREVVIGGRVFPNAVEFSMNRKYDKGIAIYSNQGNYDLLEAWVGIDDSRNFSGRCQLVVKGDGKVLYTSSIMVKGEQAQKISVSVKGYSGITIGIQHYELASGYGGYALFASPVFVRLIPQETAPPPSFSPPGNSSQSRIRVMLNGRQIGFTGTPPVRIGGRVMVPMRDIFESLGARVRWVPSNQTINAYRGNTAVQMQIGNFAATVNGRRINLDQPPILYQASTMVPLRFVAEAMNAQVNWNEYASVVTISSSNY